MPIKNLNLTNPVDNALQFLSAAQDSTEMEKPNAKTESATHKQVPIQDRPKTDMHGKELKRKRYNLLLAPSLYEDVEKIAYVENISANEAINRALALYKENKNDTLKQYAEIEKLKASGKTEK